MSLDNDLDSATDGELKRGCIIHHCHGLGGGGGPIRSAGTHVGLVTAINGHKHTSRRRCCSLNLHSNVNKSTEIKTVDTC